MEEGRVNGVTEKPFCCRACGKTLAMSTSASVRSTDGVRILAGKRVGFECECGNVQIWHADLTPRGSPLPEAPLSVK